MLLDQFAEGPKEGKCLYQLIKLKYLILWNHLNAWGKNFADCQFSKCSFGGFCGFACHLYCNKECVPYWLGMLICGKSTKKIKLPRNFNVSTVIIKFLDRFFKSVVMVYMYVYFRVVPLVKANEVSQEPLKYLNRLVF